MADEHDDSQRTEEPTQKRLDEAHKKGDVVKSQELATFIMMAGGTLTLENRNGGVYADRARALALSQRFDAALARIHEVGVVARLIVDQPDGARQHLRQVRPRQEARAPVRRDLLGFAAPQLGVVGHHEAVGDALAEALQAELLEVLGCSCLEIGRAHV